MNADHLELGDRRKELDVSAIKAISLVTYAESLGYIRDLPRCTKTSINLRSDSHRILVKVGGGHDVYCTIGDSSDCGSIIDFAMRREKLGYLEALKSLSKKNDSLSPTAQPSKTPAPSIDPDTDYRKKAAAVWASKDRCSIHPYLISRGIPATVLTDPRFVDCWRGGSHGVVVFPHIDRGQPRLCGYELRGPATKRLYKNSIT